jgi:tRNA (adenine22-N1)-methyltransferase
MNELHLSRRLETVASYIPKGSILADIGSDHAYLPCYAYLQGLIKTAVAGEINEGPLLSAKEQVNKSELEGTIDVRKGNGLDVIEPNEVDCITIAGMGGTLIRSILEEGKAKLQGVSRLILQPNIGAIKIREWLIENEWELIAETIIEEDEKIYEILVAEKGNPYQPYGDQIDAGLLLGPFLMHEKNVVFVKKWEHEKKHWQRIVRNIEQAEMSDVNKQKEAELKRKIEIVKVALQ